MGDVMRIQEASEEAGSSNRDQDIGKDEDQSSGDIDYKTSMSFVSSVKKKDNDTCPVSEFTRTKSIRNIKFSHLTRNLSPLYFSILLSIISHRCLKRKKRKKNMNVLGLKSSITAPTESTSLSPLIIIFSLHIPPLRTS